jgi:hypothetical protein
VLAREFAKVPFREVAQRERALEILAEEPESAAVVAADIRASLEGLSISTINSLRDDEAKRRKTKMFFAALGGNATDGNFSTLESALQEILVQARPDRDDSGELAEQCLAASGMALVNDWENKQDALAKACEIYRGVCARADFKNPVTESWRRTALFTALLHALANRTGELDAWWKELPEDTRTEMEEALAKTDIVDLLIGSRTAHHGNGTYVELPVYKMPEFSGDKAAASKKRDEVFLRFVSSPLSGGAINSISDFTNGGWGTQEDALRLEEQWCTASPRRGLTAQRFASFHNQNKDYGRELAAAERGLKAVRPARNGRGFEQVSWKIHALYHLNRSTEGTELFLKIARMPAEQFDDAKEQKAADDAWEYCVSQALSGPAKQTGSLTDTIKVAAVVYEGLKDKHGFWGSLESAGVQAAELLSKEKRNTEAQAAAAFALKARVRCEKAGGKPGAEWKTRAEAVLSGAAPAEPLLKKDAVWRWQESSAAAGDAWLEAGFDDSTWKSGEGPFGFGDDGLKSEISNKAADGETLVSWPFRAEFEVADPAVVRLLTLNLRVDDGAIVWINGKEAGRRNLPTGEIDHRTLAPGPINQADEGRLDPLSLEPQLLVKGKNCVAVQIHQQRPESSDAAFHAELLQSIGAAAPAVEADTAIQSLAPQLKAWPAELRKAFIP